VRRAALLAVLLFAAPAAALETAEEIQACVRGNLPHRTSAQKIELESLDRAGGRRTLVARLHWKRFADGGYRLRIRVDEPLDLRGSSFLVIENRPTDDMFMYLPATQKVRRITSGMVSDSLWGTDFGYEDIKHLQGIDAEGEVERLPDSSVEDRPVYVLSMVPGPNEESSYSKIVSFVARDSCLAIRTEFYERGDEPRKVLLADLDQLTHEEDRWLARSVEIRDLRSETRSQLRVLETRDDVEIPDRTFNPTLLGRGH
jgi:hypothetical protein